MTTVWYNPPIDAKKWNKFRDLVIHVTAEGIITGDADSLNLVTRRLITMVNECDSISQADDPGHIVWDVLHEIVADAVAQEEPCIESIDEIRTEESNG